MKEWEAIDRVQPFNRIQELKDNNIEPTEEYIHEYQVSADGKNKKTGKRGKPVRKINDHLDIDFFLNFEL